MSTEGGGLLLYTFCVGDLTCGTLQQHIHIFLGKKLHNQSQDHFKTDSRVHKVSPFPMGLAGK